MNPVTLTLELLRNKLKYRVKVSKNVVFSDFEPECSYPTLVIMIGSDGYIGHCFTIIDGIIFNTVDPAPNAPMQNQNQI
jgi:hypothetical protein